jgi:Holliday junction resolvasome RuvABC endonuclease subunit
MPKRKAEQVDAKKQHVPAVWSAEGVDRLEKDMEKEVLKLERKKKRAANKRQKKKTSAELLQTQAKSADVIIALDMSTSPGLAIVERYSGLPVRYTLVGFAQTDKQQTKFDSIAKNGKITTTLKNGDGVDIISFRAPKEKEYINNAEYYEIITSKLLQIIMTKVTSPLLSSKKCLAVIEAYAYGMRSSSVTPLAELGGVIRNKLVVNRIPFQEVSPTTIKKWFTDKGTAEKSDMWKQFKIIAPEVKLEEWLPVANFQPQKSVPSPHQDIVDAFASAHSLHSQSLN